MDCRRGAGVGEAGIVVAQFAEAVVTPAERLLALRAHALPPVLVEMPAVPLEMNPGTESGVALKEGVPTEPGPWPSWPARLFPQHHTLPSDWAAHVAEPLAAMDTPLLSPVTETGELLWYPEPLLPLPSSPSAPRPQHWTPPVDSSAHV